MTSPSAAPLRVFVHLAIGYDVRRWEQRWLKGELPGFNERSPYGYHHAGQQGCELSFSADEPESWLARLVRGGLRYLIGFDVVHAIRNRRGILAADVVWTHTESQYLSVALLLRLWPGGRRPKLLAQTVWLMDRWDRLMGWQRLLYRWLMRRADVLTFHSPLNRDRAKSLLPGSWCEFVPFGISTDLLLPAAARQGGPLRILSLGNDRHRDWATLFEAFGGRPGFTVRVATQKLRPRDVQGFNNVDLASPTTNGELMSLYRWADVVVLPLKPNLHASGITVLQEAALAGRPAVSTDVGGLHAYFGDDEVTYVEAAQPRALRNATLALMADPHAAAAQAARARARMMEGPLNVRAFVTRHVQLSRQLLARRPLEVVGAEIPAGAEAQR